MTGSLSKMAAILGASLLLASASCSTPKNITYFQDLNTEAVIAANKVLDVKVKPEDKLSIVVSTQDPALSQLFNLVTTQNRLENMSSAATGNNTGQMSFYTVDSKGNINFPVIGSIHIAGLTREQVAEKVLAELTSRDLVKDPIVTVEFVNTNVAVLGEVAHPGRYNFNEDHITILDAIAMAGDLTPNGMREEVLVLRKDSEGQQKAYKLNLVNARELAASPAYYLQQDDVIYVEPNDRKKRETTSAGNTLYTPSFWLSVGSIGISVATLIATLAK